MPPLGGLLRALTLDAVTAGEVRTHLRLASAGQVSSLPPRATSGWQCLDPRDIWWVEQVAMKAIENAGVDHGLRFGRARRLFFSFQIENSVPLVREKGDDGWLLDILNNRF